MAGGLPAWLAAKVDQRMALVNEHVKIPANAGVPLVVTPLTEVPDDAPARLRKQWDRTCDACGKYCPYPREDFYTGHVQRRADAGVLVVIFYGVCKEHAHG